MQSLNGYLAVFLTVLLLPASAIAQSASSSGQSDDDPVANVSGKWAQKVVNSSVSKVPIVGKVTTDSIGYLLLDIRQDDDELTITSEVCDVKIDSSVTKVRTVVPRSFVEGLGKQTRSARLKEKEGDGSARFYAPKTFSTVGVRLRNDQYETLPEEPHDPRVLDQDDDGHPGMTLRIEGMISGELYVIQRAWDAMRGTVRGSNYIDGLIEWGNEQVLLDSTSIFLGDQPPSRPHPNDKRSYFRTTRIKDNATCRDVVRARDRLFSRP